MSDLWNWLPEWYVDAINGDADDPRTWVALSPIMLLAPLLGLVGLGVACWLTITGNLYRMAA